MNLNQRSQFEQLPAELLYEIASYLDFKDLKNLSGVNKTLRDVAFPRIFRHISLPFSGPGVDALNEMAGSRFAKVTKSLRFRVIPSVINVSGKRELRTGVVHPIEKIYPRKEYTYHCERRYLPPNITYEKVAEYMSIISEEQSKLPRGNRALLSLATTLQQFSALEEVGVDWRLKHADTYGLNVVISRCRKRKDLCNKHLLDTIGKAINLRAKDNPITSLQLVSERVWQSIHWYPELDLPDEAFIAIRSLDIQSHGSAIGMLVLRANMPELRSLKMIVYDELDLDDLDGLCRKTRKTLNVLHIETEVFLYHGHMYVLLCNVQACQEIMTFLDKLGKDMSLEEVKVRALDRPEKDMGLLESLLRGESIP
ncbi:hypothetical protein AOR_1_1206134 [Paecilomyces variotii No. 5]|uniref:F-box domain-containing protein n=1 Tax=Byssochlamys spectabilis (strain No. 5 / NBRC 109023) TaxID=1356009 RepID=V5FQY4_BYSSN|nr:hypothetical protein AOR_1_1206134 [Paecilomyces variotii No. 5]